jgi:hypothetical protein
MDDERYQKYSIELDAHPFSARPNDLIGSVLKDTGLFVEDFETGKPFFGHQVFILKESAGKDALFTKSKPIFKTRITELYREGLILYGTW